MFRTMALNSMTDAKFFGLKECCIREELENTFLSFSTHTKKKVNALLKLIAIAHRKLIPEEKTFLKH